MQRAAHKRELARSKEEIAQLLSSAEATSVPVNEELVRRRYMKEIEQIKVTICIFKVCCAPLLNLLSYCSFVNYSLNHYQEKISSSLTDIQTPSVYLFYMYIDCGPNSTWLVSTRHVRLCRASRDERVKPCCSNMADDEQAIVLVCTSLVVFMLLHTEILFLSLIHI